MTVYAYAAIPDNSAVNVPSKINDYCQKNKMPLKKIVIDNQPSKAHWDKRELNHLIAEVLVKGDTLVTYEAANLARSTSQVLEVLELLSKHNINLHLIKYETTFSPKEIVGTKDFLHLVQDIEEDFVTRRTTDALARRRSAGLPLGRPKGRKNKSRKLDKFQGEIKKYLALHISKASVAKLLGCHAQTLYNYLDDNPEIEQEVNASLEATH